MDVLTLLRRRDGCRRREVVGCRNADEAGAEDDSWLRHVDKN